MIVKGKTYRVKGDSNYFKRKYGTPNPTIVVEGLDTEVWVGRTWREMEDNPSAMLFQMRARVENLKTSDVYFGKIDGHGELVQKDELEEIVPEKPDLKVVS